MSRVLLIHPNPKESKKVAKIFKSMNVNCEVTETFEKAFERIQAEPPALVIAEKPETLEPLVSLGTVLKKHAPVTPYVVTMKDAKMETALQIMNLGAYDCLSKPYRAIDLLMVSKQATKKMGRALIAAKLTLPKRHTMSIVLGLLLIGVMSWGVHLLRQKGPKPSLFLQSATLSGIQWQGRHLWVGDWFESMVTEYELRKALLPSNRSLYTKNIYRLQEGQPILVCNTPEFLVTVGTDLKFRVHSRGVGLPNLQTVSAPSNNPTGLTWDGTYIWSCDSETNLLYKHGPDMKVLQTVPTVIQKPVGIAWDGVGFWVLGGTPLQVARLVRLGSGYVWEGPAPLVNALPEKVTPTGFTVGFDRFWFVSGGDPGMTSSKIPQLKRKLKRGKK